MHATTTAAPALQVLPYQYKRGAIVARTPSANGFKTDAAMLAEACGLRYVNRARGYVGTSTQGARLQRLFAGGWRAHHIFNRNQAFPGDGSMLPEPWMRRRPGLWIAPPTAPEHAPLKFADNGTEPTIVSALARLALGQRLNLIGTESQVMAFSDSLQQAIDAR